MNIFIVLYALLVFCSFAGVVLYFVAITRKDVTSKKRMHRYALWIFLGPLILVILVGLIRGFIIAGNIK